MTAHFRQPTVRGVNHLLKITPLHIGLKIQAGHSGHLAVGDPAQMMDSGKVFLLPAIIFKQPTQPLVNSFIRPANGINIFFRLGQLFPTCFESKMFRLRRPAGSL